MIIPAMPDIAFRLFGIPVYWYGIIMAFAIFTAVMCANYLYNICNKGAVQNIIIDFAPMIILFGILGARIYFCLLNPSYYFYHPIEILNIREGGLSIHGAITGGIFSVIFMSRKYNVKMLKLLDVMAVGTVLGQAIGRWGNYFNSEAYGIPVVGQNWGVYIPLEHRLHGFENFELFHPAFLYESCGNIIAFVLLLYIWKKFNKNKEGFTFFSYILIYGIIRFLIEQIRLDSALNFGTIPIAEIVSIILIITGLVGCVYKFAKK